MKRPTAQSLTAIVLTLAATIFAATQPSSAQAPIYVETGRDFRLLEQVAMGGNLLTPAEDNRFAALREQAKTRAEMDRVEAEQSALLNLRVTERINAALNQPVILDQPPAPQAVPARSDP